MEEIRPCSPIVSNLRVKMDGLKKKKIAVSSCRSHDSKCSVVNPSIGAWLLYRRCHVARETAHTH